MSFLHGLSSHRTKLCLYNVDETDDKNDTSASSMANNQISHRPSPQQGQLSPRTSSLVSQANQKQQHQINVRIRRHPELVPVMPRETSSSSGNSRNHPMSASYMGQQQIFNKQHKDTFAKPQPKRCVSMTRLDQLAQPKRIFTKESIQQPKPSTPARPRGTATNASPQKPPTRLAPPPATNKTSSLTQPEIGPSMVWKLSPNSSATSERESFHTIVNNTLDTSNRDIVIANNTGTSTASNKDTSIASIKDASIASIKDTSIASIKDTSIASVKDTSIGSIRGTSIASNKDTSIASSKETVNANNEDIVQMEKNNRPKMEENELLLRIKREDEEKRLREEEELKEQLRKEEEEREARKRILDGIMRRVSKPTTPKSDQQSNTSNGDLNDAEHEDIDPNGSILKSEPEPIEAPVNY